MAEWRIEEPEQGPVVLWCDRKQVSTHDTVRDAVAKAKRSLAEGDTVVHIEPGGYRNNLKGRRRGWRSTP